MNDKDKMLCELKKLALFLSGYARDVSKVGLKYYDLPIIQTTRMQRKINQLADKEVKSLPIDLDFILENIDLIEYDDRSKD